MADPHQTFPCVHLYGRHWTGHMIVSIPLENCCCPTVLTVVDWQTGSAYRLSWIQCCMQQENKESINVVIYKAILAIWKYIFLMSEKQMSKMSKIKCVCVFLTFPVVALTVLVHHHVWYNFCSEKLGYLDWSFLFSNIKNTFFKKRFKSMWYPVLFSSKDMQLAKKVIYNVCKYCKVIVNFCKYWQVIVNSFKYSKVR